MKENEISKCNGHEHCERTVFDSGLCRLHLPADHKNSLHCDDYDQLLIDEIKQTRIRDDDKFALHWEGLNFPKDHSLFENRKYDEVRDKLEKSWINISYSNIQNIRVISYAIQELILSHSMIHGNTQFPVIKIDRLIMDSSKFLGKFHCASVSVDVDARNAVFEDEFAFFATISDYTNFTNCRFKKSCLFYGSRSPIFGKKNDHDFKIAGFDNTIFESPAQVLFQDVDLRKASFKSVSLVGVRFYNANFYQDDLSRNGLYNEVSFLKKPNSNILNANSKKLKNKKHYDHLMHEYRQLRMAMENLKDFDNSHDFYFGEMESRKNREWNPVLWIYRCSSCYGTKYIRAGIILLVLFLIHLILTTILSTNLTIQNSFCSQDTILDGIRLRDATLHSLSTVTLQRFNLNENLSFCQCALDTFFRIIFPIQAAMFLLALRNMTKR
jgi:uncharacterized protein YjbI with pentapeptide repeats